MSKEKTIISIYPDDSYYKFKYKDYIFKYEVNKRKYDSKVVPGTKGSIVIYFRSNKKKDQINQFIKDCDLYDSQFPIKGEVVFVKFKKGQIANITLDEILSIQIKAALKKKKICMIL